MQGKKVGRLQGFQPILEEHKFKNGGVESANWVIMFLAYNRLSIYSSENDFPVFLVSPAGWLSLLALVFVS